MVKKTVLKNGIRVISENIPHSHSVTIGIWVANGSRSEAAEHNGVAHFIEHLLFKGTNRRNAHQIAREIDAIGGILNAFTSREYVCYYAKVLHRFLPKAVDLLADIFLNSQFDPEEIEKERKVILQEIGLQEDTPDDLVHDLYCRKFWQGDPLGMPIIGTQKSIGALTREIIVEYRDNAYRGEEVVVAAAGLVDHAKLLLLLEGLFDRLKPGRSAAAPSRLSPGRKTEVMIRDLEQVHLCLGTLSLPQNHPKRYDAFILNTIFGGSMSSRLFQEVREKYGLAYSIYSYITSHSDSGSLAVYAGTGRDRLDDVIEIILREMKRLKTEPMAAEELNEAKEQLKGNILLSLESSDNRMTKVAKNEIYLGQYQPLRQVMKGIDRVTSGSILDLAGEIIDERFLTMAVIGKLPSGYDIPAGSSL